MEINSNWNIPISLFISWLLITDLLALEGKADDNDGPISNLKRLKKDLLAQYDKYARPVKNSSTAVPVWIQMISIVLIDLNEAEEKMILDVVVIMDWKDEHLQWDPSNYKGINRTYFAEDEIWRPDVTLFNSAPTTNNIPWNKTHYTVNNNGDVFWDSPASIGVRCPMSLLKPMEERICNISIASYSYFKDELDLKLIFTKMSTKNLSSNDNPVWKVTNISASLETVITPYQFEYSIATFTINIKRRFDFFSFVIRGPRTVSILLTLAMFWLPSTSDKKLNLVCLGLMVLTGVTLYLSLTVKSPSLLAATVTPLRIILFTTTSALLIEVIIINLSRLSDIVRPSPILTRILSGMVGRVMGVCSRLEYKEDGGMVRLPETEGEEISQATITIEEEWALVAMALDRIFFIIYAVIFVIIS